MKNPHSTSEAKYRLLAENTADVIWVFDTDSGFLNYISPSVERLLGLTVPDALNILMSDDSLKEFSEYICGKVLKRMPLCDNGESEYFTEELELHHRNGKTVYVELSCRFVINEENSKKELLGVLREITERKKLELVQSFMLQCGFQHPGEDFFQSLAVYLAETLQMDYVCIDKLEGNNLLAYTLAVYNDGSFEDNVCYTLKDTPCGEVVGKQICIFPKEVRKLFPNDIVLQEILAECYFGVTLWSSEGAPIGLIAVISRTPHTDTNFVESVLRLVAIRAAGELERKEQNDLLKKREALLNEMARLAKIGVWEFDVATMQQSWSEEVYRIHELDTTYKPVVNDGIDFYAVEARPEISRAVQRAIDFGESFDLELRFYTSKGNQRWVHSIGRALVENGITVKVFGTIQDITEKQEDHEALVFQGEKLRKLNEEKDKLFSILAHDLKSPFNSFLGFTQILAEEFEELSPADVKLMALGMNKAAHNLFNLLEDLLEWSRLQRGVLKFNPNLFSVSNKCRECLEPLQEAASRKGVHLTWDFPGDLQINADLHMFKAILRNITTNSVKFTPKGGRISVSAQKTSNNMIEFSIIDSGIGIPPELQKNLFSISGNISRKGTDGEPGTGLGLIITREFVEKHEGKIRIESNVENGTSVFFTLKSLNHTHK